MARDVAYAVTGHAVTGHVVGVSHVWGRVDGSRAGADSSQGVSGTGVSICVRCLICCGTALGEG